MLAGPQSIRLDLQDRPGAIFPGLEPGELTGAGVIARESGPHTLRVSIEQVPCRDTMSGEPSPLAVTVELDGGILRGCGVLLQRGGGAR